MRWLFVSRVFPEYNSSAAGVRLREFIKVAKEASGVVHFACACKNVGKATYLEMLSELDVAYHNVPFNDEDAMGKCLEKAQPDVVVWDTFVAEEAYGWMLKRAKPNAMTVLDMQDMHSLRKARESVILDDNGSISEALYAQPEMLSKSRILERELASIHRSDLTIACGHVEKNLLTQKFQIRAGKLAVSPLLFASPRDRTTQQQANAFLNRSDFCFLGGFRHPPNKDCVHWLCNQVWPTLRQRVPGARLHVYGSYLDQNTKKLDSRENGFLMHGQLKDLSALGRHRVMLCPVRFGAGIKGKIIDAWSFGVPVVTTPIGAESIGRVQDQNGPLGGWGGISNCYDSQQVVDAACLLYSDQTLWEKAVENASNILLSEFDQSTMKKDLLRAVQTKFASYLQDRTSDYIQAVLNDSRNRGHEYMSRWIKLKEQMRSTK